MGRGPEGRLSTHKEAHQLDPDRNPWDRQPEETGPNWEWFCAYRDQEDRNMTKLAVHLEVNDETLKSCARRWHWSYRVDKFDLYMSKLEFAELVRVRRMMNGRHRRMAKEALAKFQKWLDSTDPGTWKPFEAKGIAELAVKMEREATAANVAHHDNTGDTAGEVPSSIGDITGLDGSEATQFSAELYKLLEKAQGGQS